MCVGQRKGAVERWKPTEQVSTKHLAADGQQKVITTLKLRGCGVSEPADPVLFHSQLRVESCVLQ